MMILVCKNFCVFIVRKLMFCVVVMVLVIISVSYVIVSV